jgi:hypothetical protein
METHDALKKSGNNYQRPILPIYDGTGKPTTSVQNQRYITKR